MTIPIAGTALIEGEYRYSLTRLWDGNRPMLGWCMLNPSTADGQTNDATIRKCIYFAMAWGYGGIDVVNLFALRARNPIRLVQHHNPRGPKNAQTVLDTVSEIDTVAAWGASFPSKQAAYVQMWAETLRSRGAYVLGLTRDGHPRHPLYMRNDSMMIKWSEVA